ncbi:CBS domain containing protein [Pirellula staleyi DSM 6068]|uniref:CBS domain containing protein n=1 Tax=Pirellula staleyi (strain ATCC 27377 / DSM 6068 / ICPB 4128) TaxID=530564 RepID=D2R7H0_PIRSD|nr:CBS domain-containing protein [Pirellula staleyi]ADB15666.1 CBS domain containing protein [Pirellula staleyi DSM 6068]
MNRAQLKRRVLHAVFQRTLSENRLQKLTAADIMTPGPTCVDPDATAMQLVELFDSKRFRHLLVTQGTTLVGVISDRDIGRLFGMEESPERNYLAGITAGELMSEDLVVVDPTTPLSEAVRLIVDEGISCLPVVVAGQPVGVVTSTDLYLALEQLLSCIPALAAAAARSETADQELQA